MVIRVVRFQNDYRIQEEYKRIQSCIPSLACGIRVLATGKQQNTKKGGKICTLSFKTKKKRVCKKKRFQNSIAQKQLYSGILVFCNIKCLFYKRFKEIGRMQPLYSLYSSVITREKRCHNFQLTFCQFGNVITQSTININVLLKKYCFLWQVIHNITSKIKGAFTVFGYKVIEKVIFSQVFLN